MNEDHVNRSRNMLMRPPTVKASAHQVDGPTPCCTCGGPVAKQDGDTWGPWRRHPACSPVDGSEPDRLVAACRALAVADLARTDAALIPFTVPRYAETHPEPVWSSEPLRHRLAWRHLDRKALAKAVKMLPRLRRRAGLDPSRCQSGACGWCGTATSAGWFTSRLSWPDGSAAPLCRTCHEVDVKHGKPNHPNDLRLALAEAITRAPVMLGETAPAGLVPYAEQGDRDGGEPWAHLRPEAVEAYRWATWGRFGGTYAPPEHRAEALAHRREHDAQIAARNAAQIADEHTRNDVYGFES